MRQQAVPPRDIEALVRRLAAKRRGAGGQLLNESDVERFVATICAVPSDVRSVVDVGCGLGVLPDVLRQLGYDARGADLDAEALAAMTSPGDVASVADLPYASASFDVVVANEVLEHLPVDVFDAARAEISRVARRTIVVTVPNAESLESASTQCPTCRCVYSLHGHVRRFEPATIESLFPGFRCVSYATVGPFKVRHRVVEWVIRRRILGRWPARAGAVCPQCAYRQPGTPESTELGARGGIASRLLRVALGFPWRRWWIVARYDRAPD